MIKKIIIIVIIFVCLMIIIKNYQHFETKVGSVSYDSHNFTLEDIDDLFRTGEELKPLKTYNRKKIIGTPGVGVNKTIQDFSFKPEDIKEKFGNIGIIKENNVSYVDNAALVGKLFEISRILYQNDDMMMNIIHKFKEQIYNLESDIIKIKQKL